MKKFTWMGVEPYGVVIWLAECDISRADSRGFAVLPGLFFDLSLPLPHLLHITGNPVPDRGGVPMLFIRFSRDEPVRVLRP